MFKKLEKFEIENYSNNFDFGTLNTLTLNGNLVLLEDLIKRAEALLLLDGINVENVHKLHGEGFNLLKTLCFKLYSTRKHMLILWKTFWPSFLSHLGRVGNLRSYTVGGDLSWSTCT